MRRVYKKVVSIIGLAAMMFSIVTCDVKVQAADLIKKNPTTTSSTSYLTKEQQDILDDLDTDLAKVNWGVQYSPKGMDGIIISVAPYVDGSSQSLLVAVTNIYNQDVTFDAKGSVKGKNGQEVGTVTFFESALRPGNTVVKSVFCDSIPTGEIYWSHLDLPKVFDTSAYWESDWTLTTDMSGYYQLKYSIESDVVMMPGVVTAVVLDAYGNVLDVATDFNSTEAYYAGDTIDFFTKSFNANPADVAVFSNPLKTKK